MVFAGRIETEVSEAICEKSEKARLMGDCFRLGFRYGREKHSPYSTTSLRNDIVKK